MSNDDLEAAGNWLIMNSSNATTVLAEERRRKAENATSSSAPGISSAENLSGKHFEEDPQNPNEAAAFRYRHDLLGELLLFVGKNFVHWPSVDISVDRSVVITPSWYDSFRTRRR